MDVDEDESGTQHVKKVQSYEIEVDFKLLDDEEREDGSPEALTRFDKQIATINGTAYPPTRKKVYSPLNLAYSWAIADYDDIFLDAIRQSTVTIRAAAIAEGQDIANAPLYSNYALFDTPFE